MAVYNPRERDIEIVRVVLASYKVFAANMVDIDAMGIPDPEGHSRHIGDWRSNGGKTQSKAAAYCPTWAFEDQASCSRNITYERCPLGAWKKSQTAHKL
jgi:hypothetical protein